MGNDKPKMITLNMVAVKFMKLHLNLFSLGSNVCQSHAAKVNYFGLEITFRHFVLSVKYTRCRQRIIKLLH